MTNTNFHRNHSLSLSLLIYGLILLTIVAATESTASAQATTSQPATDKTQKVDRSRLEVIEELSESLANDLLELSVAARDRDQQLTAEFFPFEIVANPFRRVRRRPKTRSNGLARTIGK